VLGVGRQLRASVGSKCEHLRHVIAVQQAQARMLGQGRLRQLGTDRCRDLPVAVRAAISVPPPDRFLQCKLIWRRGRTWHARMTASTSNGYSGCGSRRTCASRPSARIATRALNKAAPQLMYSALADGSATQSARSQTPEIRSSSPRHREPPRLRIMQRRRCGCSRDHLLDLLVSKRPEHIPPNAHPALPDRR
jgi:hypothetical protein